MISWQKKPDLLAQMYEKKKKYSKEIRYKKKKEKY